MHSSEKISPEERHQETKWNRKAIKSDAVKNPILISVSLLQFSIANRRVSFLFKNNFSVAVNLWVGACAEFATICWADNLRTYVRWLCIRLFDWQVLSGPKHSRLQVSAQKLPHAYLILIKAYEFKCITSRHLHLMFWFIHINLN